MSPFTISVECYAGYCGEETPRRFFLHDRQIDVVDVIDRWLAPDHRYFKLKGNDGALYIIRNDVARDLWELTMYVSGQGDLPRQAGVTPEHVYQQQEIVLRLFFFYPLHPVFMAE